MGNIQTMEKIEKVFNTLLQNATTPLINGDVKTIDLNVLIETTKKRAKLSEQTDCPIFSEGMTCFALALIIVQFNSGKSIINFDDFTEIVPQILAHRDYIIPCRYMNNYSKR